MTHVVKRICFWLLFPFVSFFQSAVQNTEFRARNAENGEAGLTAISASCVLAPLARRLAGVPLFAGYAWLSWVITDGGSWLSLWYVLEGGKGH